MKIAEIIEDNSSKIKVKGIADEFEYLLSEMGTNQIIAEILALIPANMEVPVLEECAGPLSVERRNLILGRNAGLDEVRAKMEGK